MKTFLIIYIMALIAVLMPVPALGAETPSSLDDKPETFSSINLTPPPEEVLTVPGHGANETANAFYAIYAFIVAIAAAAILLTAYIKKVRSTRAILTAAAIAAVLFLPCLARPALAEHDFGVPLDTSNIMLFAYYYEPSGWTLINTLPAFESYTNYGNYIDGIVRVWMDQSASNNFVGSECPIDVRVRVRADGWILAWLTKSHSYAYIVFWGHSAFSSGPPVIGATVPTRAIQRVYYAAGKTFPGHTAIKIWDFSHPTATKILIFGKSITQNGGTQTHTFYYTLFRNDIEVIDTATSFDWGEQYYQSSGSFSVDGVTLLTFSSSKYDTTYWVNLNLPPTATMKGVKHTVTVQASAFAYLYVNIAFIFWLK